MLDTSVVSELMRPAPDRAVLSWANAQSASGLYSTTLTEAEILHGIAVLPRGRRRAALTAAAVAMFDEEFAGRLLPFGRAAARVYADIAAARRRVGRPIATIDAQIAAIARSVDATLATRNLRDFAGCGLTLVDPWHG